MKRQENRRWKRALLLTAAVTMLWGSTVCASPMELPEGLTEAAGETISVFVTVTEDAKGYEKPDADSREIAQFGRDRKLLMIQRREDDWCEVMDAGKSVYVQTQYVRELPVEEALTKEMQELEAARAAQAEADVRMRKEVLRGRIVGVVIAVLIAGVFLAGIVAVVRSDGDGQPEGGEEQPANGEEPAVGVPFDIENLDEEDTASESE